ncbi:PREDICTED: protein I'm not dead yet-like isoform X3 [Papilio xuthus]|uniref:Protein I'm not dead yet-like isoform X3 n=1 Tax=Papilio xuthus TaxID=66420 RepID=A0AAJ6Z957_PAPXU|nr:PREDICTED: protein I'm not dead yet-like isoform X3 [Papilio xuthus]
MSIPHINNNSTTKIMQSNSSEPNLLLIRSKTRMLIFYKMYWKTILFLATPLLLLPLYFIGANNIYVTRSLLDCLGVMMINVAIEYCNVHKRIALRIILMFGCSHYRLSFILFFSTLVLSMWVSNVITCGVMIPLVRSILMELEKLGIIEVYENIDKDRRSTQIYKPTLFTSFYFLGIAYSSSIGGMATLFGSRTNQIFKTIFETTFPTAPKIEFPHFMLLNLPAALLLEILVYLWLNFYFLGMFRSYRDASLQMSMTDEETQYMNTLLSTRYQQLGKVTFHEAVVSAVIVLAAALQVTSNTLFTAYSYHESVMSHIKLSAPSMVCVVLLFIIPINLDFTKFFKKRTGNLELQTAPSKTCLNWSLVKDSVPWSVLFVIGSSNTVFEALEQSKMTQELEKFFLIFTSWSAPAAALIVIVLCKTLTEFACNSSVAHALLPHIARVCVISKVNPQYLMLSATLASSLPFHLMTGTPANAMVLAYVHIPPKVMMLAGFGPSVLAVLTVWFTVTMWSKAIWPDILLFPKWAEVNSLE